MPGEAERVAQLLRGMREVVGLTWDLGVPAPPPGAIRADVRLGLLQLACSIIC
ncbi:hypothetical protein [Streptomyces sp. NPDC054786]